MTPNPPLTYLDFRALLAARKKRKRKPKQPFTYDFNKTLEPPRQDSDTHWNQVEKQE